MIFRYLILLLSLKVIAFGEIPTCWSHDFNVPRSRAVESLQHAKGLCSIYKHIRYEWEYRFFQRTNHYSDYIQKFEDLFWWCDQDFTDRIKWHKSWLQELKQQNKNKSNKLIEDEITRIEQLIQITRNDWTAAKQSLNLGFQDVSDLLIQIYTDCIHDHQHPRAFYERGYIFFDRGNSTAFISDINALIASGHAQTSDLIFQLGKAYNDANQYDQAIRILSEAINKDPSNKAAYFERAMAFFETGHFDLALSDYILSDIHPTFIDSCNEYSFHYLQFSKGIALGCLKGGVDSAFDFVPSLFATAYGLGKGLWAYATDPIGVSKELVDGCVSCIEFIKDNISSELLAQIIPELKECIEK